MFQFGELLTLGLCTVAVVYVALHRRQINQVPGLRPFLVPFVLVTVAFLATVVEGLPGGGDASQIIFWERSPEAVQRGGWLAEALNLVEHTVYVAATVALALLIWRKRKGAGAGTP